MKKVMSLFLILFSVLFFLACENKQENKQEENKIIKKEKKETKKLSVKEKKERFVKLLQPAVTKVFNKLNAQYLEVKEKVEKNIEDKRIEKLKATYKVSSNEELLLALKPHPISIALAQAAMESSWATSRFFNKANNVFGVWSFNKDEPRIAAGEKRGEQTIWLKKYNSIEESVEDYYKVLARSQAFSEFREQKIQTDDPHILVKFLDKYSEKGDEYGKELSAMIKFNKFAKFDIE